MRIIQTQNTAELEQFRAVIQQSLGKTGLKTYSAATWLESGWIVFDDADQPLATAVLYDNPALQYEGKAAACFGQFDTQANLQAVNLLLRTMLEQAKSLGKSLLIGPMNGSTWETYRLAINGFDVDYLMDLEHPAFYPDILQQAGMSVLAGYKTNIDNALQYDLRRLERSDQLLAPLKLQYRNIRLEQFDEELTKIYHFCMESFAHNFLFTPIEESDFKAKYLEIQKFIQPEYVILAEEPDGNLCGLLFAVPNYKDSSQKGMIIKTLAKKHGNKYAGMATKLSAMLYDRLQSEHFDYALHAFMEDQNASGNASLHFSGKTMKQYQLFMIQ